MNDTELAKLQKIRITIGHYLALAIVYAPAIQEALANGLTPHFWVLLGAATGGGGILSVLPSILPRISVSAVDKARLAAVAGAVMILACMSGCAWFRANEPALVTDVSTDALCVVAQAAEGQTSAAAIAVTCGIPTAAQVTALIAKAIAAISPAPADVARGVGGRPETPAETALLAKLAAVH